MEIVTPILKLQNSSLFLPSAPIPIKDINSLFRTLIPSLTLVGALFSSPLSMVNEENLRAAIKTKNPILKPLSSKQQLSLIGLERIVNLQGKAVLDVSFSYDNQEDINKIIQKEIQKIRQTVLLDGKKVWGYTKDSLISQVENNNIKVNFIVPNIKMPQYLTVSKTTTFKGTIPISILVQDDSLNSCEVIDVFVKQLSIVLRTMIKNSLPFRTVQSKIKGIITENYSEVPITPKLQKGTEILAKPTENKAPVGLIVVILVACLIMYIGIKFI